MHAALIALCVLFFAFGHLVRDGWPALHSTHLARFGGAIWCFDGLLAVADPNTAFFLGAAVWAGFYFDMKHGDGQSATGWRDAGFLALSGVTSLVPLFLVAGGHLDLGALTYTLDFHYAPVLLLGLTKPAIWFAAWAINPARWWTPAYPTRVAAVAFGCVVAAATLLVA